MTTITKDQALLLAHDTLAAIAAFTNTPQRQVRLAEEALKVTMPFIEQQPASAPVPVAWVDSGTLAWLQQPERTPSAWVRAKLSRVKSDECGSPVFAALPTAPQQPEQPGEVHQTAPVQTEASTWRPIETLPYQEDEPFLVLRKGNSVSRTVVVSASWFEGNLYPDWLDACVDFDDRITDATHWMPLPEAPSRRSVAEAKKPNDPAVSAVLPPVQADNACIADAACVIEWATSNPRRPANAAFTAGPERQAAYWIEWAEQRAAGVATPAPAQPFKCAVDGADSLCQTCRPTGRCSRDPAGLDSGDSTSNKPVTGESNG